MRKMNWNSKKKAAEADREVLPDNYNSNSMMNTNWKSNTARHHRPRLVLRSRGLRASLETAREHSFRLELTYAFPFHHSKIQFTRNPAPV